MVPPEPGSPHRGVARSGLPPHALHCICPWWWVQEGVRPGGPRIYGLQIGRMDRAPPPKLSPARRPRRPKAAAPAQQKEAELAQVVKVEQGPVIVRFE